MKRSSSVMREELVALDMRAPGFGKAQASTMGRPRYDPALALNYRFFYKGCEAGFATLTDGQLAGTFAAADS